jgi:hypothetical protein
VLLRVCKQHALPVASAHYQADVPQKKAANRQAVRNLKLTRESKLNHNRDL